MSGLEHLVYIGLGSNQSNPVKQISQALSSITEHPDLRLLKASSLYQSSPVGPQNQPDYINAVACIETCLSPDDLLTTLQTIERGQGRDRVVETRWGPRTLDIDILLYNALIHQSECLTIPHPELTKRAFVLYPLAELAPALVIPGYGSIQTLFAGCLNQSIQKL